MTTPTKPLSREPTEAEAAERFGNAEYRAACTRPCRTILDSLTMADRTALECHINAEFWAGKLAGLNARALQGSAGAGEAIKACAAVCADMATDRSIKCDILAKDARTTLRRLHGHTEAINALYAAERAILALSPTQADRLDQWEDWFKGEVDCDGNKLVTVRLGYLSDVVALIEGLPGYGTCTNALEGGRLKDQPSWVRFYNLVAALSPKEPSQ
jgi:hypothetical protein